MREKLIRLIATLLSVLLLASSAGVIIWIVRDEGTRLAAREKAALEAAEQSQRAASMSETNEAMEASQAAEKLFHDIDTLLTGLSNDDLPDED